MKMVWQSNMIEFCEGGAVALNFSLAVKMPHELPFASRYQGNKDCNRALPCSQDAELGAAR